MLKNKLKFLKSEIFLIFLLALIIRSFFVYLNYPIVIHPDEPTVVNSTINLRYNINPGHFDWPTAYYYFTYPIFFTYEKVYFLLNDLNIIDNLIIPNISYYLISRFVTAIFGALTSVIVYLILKNLNVSQELSLLGACFMALIPFHVTRSSLSLTDIPMVFLCGVVVLLLSKNITNFKNSSFILACFFAGLSVSTKYNGYMIFLTLALFILLIRGFKISDFYLYLKSAFSAVFGFFVGTPFFIFDYDTFFSYIPGRGALWQFDNVGKVDFYSHVSNFFLSIFWNYLDLFGLITLIFSVLFIIFFIYKKEYLVNSPLNRFKLILIVQFLFIFWSASGVAMQRSHYYILVYLFLPIFTILFFSEYLKSKNIIYTSYILFILFSTFVLFNRVDDNASVKFYSRVLFSDSREKYLIAFNNTEIEGVLKKLNVSKFKINKNSLSIPSKVTHSITNFDICEKSKNCKFNLLAKIESRGDSDIIYVYERKK